MANGDLLGIGTSGMLAFQRSLSTISQNIANVNTRGYSRQTADLVTRPPQISGFGFIGTGVDTSTITRSYDAFVENNVRSSTSSKFEFESFFALAAQLDNVLANPDTGMDASIQRFFDAVQDVADDPSSSSARQVMFNEGQQLTKQFNEVAGWIDGLRSQVNGELRSSVTDINQLSQSIAEINESIVISQARAGGQPPNDLLDQRDQFIKDLSELVSISTLEQDDGSVNVLVGTGQLLVRSNQASSLEVFIESGADPQHLGIRILGGVGAVPVPVTDQLSGGKIGGALSFRDRMLDPASNSLGLAAIGLSSFFNDQQTKGVDLDGALGIDFFNVPQPDSITLAGTLDNVAVSFDEISQLTNADYQLQFNTGVWSLLRTDTGQSITMTGTGTAVDPFIADGMSLEVLAAPANGDTYLIRPTRNGALNLEMNLGNSRQIATAAPVRSNASLTNVGSGTISAGVVTDINNAAFQTLPGTLSPPVLVRFTGGVSYDVYDNTNPAAPVLLEAGIAYNPATGGDIFPTPGGLNYGYQMSLSGAPVAGDEFTIEFNTGGTGDNRNALLLASLPTEKLMSGGTESFIQTYTGLVADVGTGTAQSERNSITQQQLHNQAVATRQSISGVNLDEEAANLVRFQQAYQAAAQVISTAQSLFDTLLGVVRR